MVTFVPCAVFPQGYIGLFQCNKCHHLQNVEFLTQRTKSCAKIHKRSAVRISIKYSAPKKSDKELPLRLYAGAITRIFCGR